MATSVTTAVAAPPMGYTGGTGGDAQRLERAIQLLDARLARSDLFNDGTVKIVPATSNVGE